MNAEVSINPYPPAAEFVHDLWTRVRTGYPQSMSITTRALVQAGAERGEMLSLVGNATTFGSFLVGCCAEELVTAGCTLKGRAERHYVREVAKALAPLARPIKAKRVGPELRGLIAAYSAHPVRLRVKTVEHLLAVNGLGSARLLLQEDQACQLQVECSITVDGIAGCLLQIMESASVTVKDPDALFRPAP
ncbi:MAG: hypothetical protein ACXIVF_09830 [Rhizobiaceae bacterium]